MDVDKLKKMAGVVRIGGKGSVRRKKKVLHKTTTIDDKRLQNILKRIGVNIIPQIEEVNIYKDDTVIQLLNPKVEVSLPANTWVVSGSPKTKGVDSDAQEFLPDILNQLGPDKLRELVEELQNSGLTAEEKTLIKSILLRYDIGANQSVGRND